MSTPDPIEPTDPSILAFMALASQRLNQALPLPKDVFSFEGQSAAEFDERLALVFSGIKTATTLWPMDPEPLWWGVGDLCVIVDSKDEPAAIIRITSMVRCKFRDVSARHAMEVGEDDYEQWVSAYRRVYRHKAMRLGEGYVFTEDSFVLCEKFELVYPKRA